MAETVYTSGKSVTSSYGYYRGALRVSVSTSATKYTISVNAYTQMYGAAYYGVQTILTGAASGKASGYASAAASSYTNVPDTVVSKSVSVTRTHSDQIKTFTVQSKGVSVSGVGAADGQTPTRSYTVTVPKLDSYTVKFNANGGTGSMASLTKWYGESLTLSGNTFTRTGYTFQGWATSASGDVKYRDGASYTANAAVTLYAVWQKESATETAPRIVSFNAVRTDASKNPSENGEYAVVSYVVEPGILNGSEVEPVITVTYQDGSQTETAQPDTAIEIGQVAKVFTLTARNTGGQLTVTSLATAPAIFYTMDFLAGGRGIGVGGRAVAGSSNNGLMTVDMDADFVGNATAVTQPTTDNSTKIATTAFVQAVAAGGGGTVPVPYDFDPKMDGTASHGSASSYARGDHVHPSDTTKANAADLAAVATSGLYSDLTGTPSLATVATTGDYDDLTNKPTIPASPMQSDWNESDTSSLAYIQNKPTLATVATTGDYDDLIDKPTIPPVKTWYGTSNTDAATAAKTVTCSGFSLSDGAIIGILFSTANTAAILTLNVNGTGERVVYVGDATVNATTNTLKWSANTMLYFMYDGTYWRYIGAMAAASVVTPDGGGAWWGTSSTAATTRAKASTIANYRLTKGAIVAIRFSNTNTYTSNSVQLNINSTGAKSIYNKAGATSSTNTFTWAANDTLLFMFDGSYYRYIGGSSYDVPSPSSATPEMDGTGAAGSSADYARADHVHPSDSTKADVSSLAAVATSGAYSDLSGTPTLATVATTGDYDDLTDTPNLAAVATSGAYSDLSGTPTLAAVATSGAYSDLSGTPNLAAVATSGSYTDLTNKPTIPAAQVQSDWSETNSSSLAFILNKPTIPAAGLPTGGTSGQVLAKSSNADYAVGWVNQSGGGGSIPSTTAMLKGDGSGNAAAATAGTDYVEPSALSGYGTDIDVTAQTQAPYLTTISLKNGNTTLDSANIPLASSSGQGMMSAAMFDKLNGIETDPSVLFALEQYVVINGVSTANNGVAENTVTESKAGYFPLCVAGWTSNNRYPNVYGCRLTAQSVGSASIFCGASNFSGSTRTLTVSAVVLWVKVS